MIQNPLAINLFTINTSTLYYNSEDGTELKTRLSVLLELQHLLHAD